MAFTGITCTEAQIDQKTGAGASAAYTDTMKTQALLQAESLLNIKTGKNWSDWYATSPNVDIKYIITMITSSWVAIEAIKYDMNSYTTRYEAEDMIQILQFNVNQGMKILTEGGSIKWIEDNQ